MKRFIIGSLSFLLVSAVLAPAVKAIPERTAAGSSTERIVSELSAVNLVELSYRGEFKDQGISSYAKFISAVNRGDLTAEDLIEAGIADGRLPSDALEDDGFVFSVERSMLRVTDHD